MENVRRGTFVVEYVGEIITNEEAERRGQVPV
jgi:SET domain-containing protein